MCPAGGNGVPSSLGSGTVVILDARDADAPGATTTRSAGAGSGRPTGRALPAHAAAMIMSVAAATIRGAGRQKRGDGSMDSLAFKVCASFAISTIWRLQMANRNTVWTPRKAPFFRLWSEGTRLAAPALQLKVDVRSLNGQPTPS